MPTTTHEPTTGHDMSPTSMAAPAGRSRRTCRWRCGGAGAVLVSLLVGGAACAKTADTGGRTHSASSTITTATTTAGSASTTVPTSSGAAKNARPGADVKEMQMRLSAVGCGVGRTDGVFGPETLRALRAFQANAGLTVDADYGPRTVAALAAAANNRRPACAGAQAPSTTAASTTTEGSSTRSTTTTTNAAANGSPSVVTGPSNTATTVTTDPNRSTTGPATAGPTITGPTITGPTITGPTTAGPTTAAAGEGGGGGGGGAPPCGPSAITAAVTETGAVVRQLDGFGCAGGWAYAFATIDGPPEGVGVTYLLQANGSSWVSADRSTPCNTHSVPDVIYANACQTN